MEERIFIISFPKMGRTWMRVLLSRYVQLLNGLEEFELKLHDRGSITPYFTPQFIFTHARSDRLHEQHSQWKRLLPHLPWLPGQVRYPFDFSKFNNSKVIFMMRDPRDTLVSFYHQLTRREQNGKKKPYDMAEFLRNPLIGAPRLVEFMNKIVRERMNFEHHFVFYEDLKSDTSRELTEILRFAGIKIDPVLVNDSVHFAQFENMRKMELQGIHGAKLQPGNAKDIDSFKVRKGKVGSFRQELNVKDIRYLDNLFNKKLDEYYQRYKNT